MKTIFISIFYNILKFFNKLSSNRMFPVLFQKFQEDAYTSKKINNIDIKFFIPNQIIKWRVDSFYETEPDTLEWINGFDEKDKIIFWDIGANIGLYSIFAASAYKNIEIVSFEPSTSNLRVLSRNISINKMEEKIKINQLPLSDKINEHAIMNESEFIEGWSMSTFNYKNNFEGKKLVPKQKYKIFGSTINYLLDNKILNIPNYIKIDVDGIEHKILKGAEKYLDNEKIKSMLIEINENFIEQHKTIIDIMTNKGFKVKHKHGTGSLSNDERFKKTFNYLFERK